MPENQNTEWKETWRDEYLKWVCGFANAQGGKIYIGIDDTGNIKPLNNIPKLLEDIPNKIKMTLGIVADVNLISTADGEYVEIAIDPQPYPISYHGEYHYRSGSTKQILTGHQLNQFLMRKMGISWDSVPVSGVKTEHMRMDSFDIFREKAVKSGRMTNENVNIDNTNLLDSLNLTDGDLVKRAGILLFHHNPEKWIPGSYIKIGYFTSDADILYQDEIHGSLLQQAEKTIDLIFTKYLKGIISYDGITRVENYPYPREAIREAVLNAIAHKNYASLIPIQIKIYDDKIFISNDGVLPDGWTIETLMNRHKSQPYNPLIANTFYRAGLIESWGRGIEKINTVCTGFGIAAPEFDIHTGDFAVVFKAKVRISDVPQDVPQDVSHEVSESSGIERKILDMIESDNKITTETMASALNISRKTIQRCISKMHNVHYVGSGYSGHWEIDNSNENS